LKLEGFELNGAWTKKDLAEICSGGLVDGGDVLTDEWGAVV